MCRLLAAGASRCDGGRRSPTRARPSSPGTPTSGEPRLQRHRLAGRSAPLPRSSAARRRRRGADGPARAGLPLDPYFSASKLRWILDNVPEARRCSQRGRLRLGTSDTFFLDRLTGRYATDVTTARAPR